MSFFDSTAGRTPERKGTKMENSQYDIHEEAAGMKTETKAKHTPGPWSLEDWNYSEMGREHVPVIRTACDAIAEVLPLWNASIDREPERIANASLIAAAPDLLAACIRMVQTWERGESWHYGDSNSFNDPIGQARAAITRAEGAHTMTNTTPLKPHYIGKYGSTDAHYSRHPTASPVRVRVQCLDERRAFRGRLDVLMAPVDGEGSAWVDASRVVWDDE